MEAFTPAKDRKYGYFCLPILYKDRLIGRLDPKAHRKSKLMEIKNIYLEKGVMIDQEMVDALKEILESFKKWHGMKELKITAARPTKLRKALQ
jgi:hypothetical protein